MTHKDKARTAPQRLSPSSLTARILLIDDDEIVTNTISMMLKTGSHQVVAAYNGVDALREFDAQPFDLVITDLFMPGMSGWEIVKEIRKRSAKTPIMLLTGSIEAVTAHENHHLDEMGVFEIMMKPIRMNDLLSRVDLALRSRIAEGTT